MPPIKVQIGGKPTGRVYRRGAASNAPGWYVDYFLRGELRTVRLFVQEDQPAGVALAEAARYLGCPETRLQVNGPAGRRSTRSARPRAT